MAVVQISRIQIRRGQARTGTGLPQLASGEMAWAVDTQELYIGNGAVSEGSPATGNTKVLTLNDLSVNGNLLGVVQYAYKPLTIQTGSNGDEIITRELQARLDDRVTTWEFGAAGDYNIESSTGTDDTAALQRAIDQLFLNATGPAWTSAAARIELVMPAGVYQTTSTIFIPSYASLVGHGLGKTIIFYNPVSSIIGSTVISNSILFTTSATTNMIGASVTGEGIPSGASVIGVVAGESLTINMVASSSNTNQEYVVTLSGPAIQFINDLSTIGNPSSLESTLGVIQPRNIQIAGLTIQTPTGQNTCLQLDAVRDSLFEDLQLIGTWGGVVNQRSCGIVMNAVSSTSMVTTQHNIFRNIVFSAFTNAVYSKQDTMNNVFDNCYLTDAQYGFLLGVGADGTTIGQQTGPQQTQVIGCKFYDIKREGVYLGLGTKNSVSNCKFNNVGNDGGAQPTYPQVYFGTPGNTTHNMESDRGDALFDPLTVATKYIPEFAGCGVYKSFGSRSVYVAPSASPEAMIRIPVNTSSSGIPVGSISYEIDYIYRSNSLYENAYTRSGKISISADVDRIKLHDSDEYNHAGNDPQNTIAVQLTFYAEFIDIEGTIIDTNYVVNGQVPYAIQISQINDMLSDIGYFTYSYTAIV